MNSGELENPELVEEYLASLQDQLDALRSRNERLNDRISQLEAERDELTKRLPRRKRPKNRGARPTTRESRSIEIPGVGTVGDLALPVGPIGRPDFLVATVLDEFSDAAFRYEFDSLGLSAGHWQTELEGKEPALLLVESAYRGPDGSWAGRLARFGRPSQALQDLVTWFKERGIPTVFWNKEDPVNHDWFIASSSLFDWVFTVDSDMVDTYRRRLGHDRIGVMQFAAQPVIHHPGDERLRVGRVGFAGSYYAAKHPERRTQMDMLLTPVRDSGLHIFDRMDRQDDPRFAWPPELADRIVGSLTYPQTVEIYRRYRVFINVNTVTGSPTMCARRVYELLASGAQVVSGPAKALDGVPVRVAHNETEALTEVEAALSSGRNEAGIEWVSEGNTMSDRVDTLMDRVLN